MTIWARTGKWLFFILTLYFFSRHQTYLDVFHLVSASDIKGISLFLWGVSVTTTHPTPLKDRFLLRHPAVKHPTVPVPVSKNEINSKSRET